MKRQDFTRPIAVAMTLTVLGEAAIFLLWGVHLFPGGALWHKAVWTGVCGIAMGATIGALVDLVVIGRMEGRRALFRRVGFVHGLVFRNRPRQR